MTVGMGLVGSGFMGRTLAYALREIVPGARLAAVFGGRGAAALVREHGVDEAHHLEALLARRDVGAVLVARRASAHAWDRQT